MTKDVCHATARRSNINRTRTGKIYRCSTSTFTVTRVQAWAPAIKLAGPPWLLRCWSTPRTAANPNALRFHQRRFSCSRIRKNSDKSRKTESHSISLRSESPDKRSESPEKKREIDAPAERHVRTLGHCREMKIGLDMRFQRSSAGASHSRLILLRALVVLGGFDTVS